MKKNVKKNFKKRSRKNNKKQNIMPAINLFALVFSGIALLFAGISFQNISGLAVYDNSAAASRAKAAYDDGLNDRGIFPMVDPAIYKPGDNSFTIYGSCLDSSFHPLESSSAKITIYNKTQGKFVDSAAMSSMVAGRFNFSTTAPTNIGNYFVEINCTDGSSWALAYDNFQIADWAGDIDDIEGYIEDVDNGGLSTINSEVAGLDGAAMRGTDSAALASSLTTHDTDIKTYVDKIDDATNGLTAIKAEVEGIGGAAMRGTDSAMLASSYVTERGTDGAALASSYTAARATKIDNLDTTVSSRLAAASYTAERGTDGAALASSYTATRAGYLDRLDTTISSRLAAASYVTERGTDNAETEASASSRYSAVYGMVDNAYSACGSGGPQQDTAWVGCNGQACPAGWTKVGCWEDTLGAGKLLWVGPTTGHVGSGSPYITVLCCLAR